MRQVALDSGTPGSVASSSARDARARAARRRASLARRRRLAPTVSPAIRPAGPVALAVGSSRLTEVEIERRVAHVARVFVQTIRSVPMPGVAPLRRRDWLLISGIVVVEALVVLLLGWGAR